MGAHEKQLSPKQREKYERLKDILMDELLKRSSPEEIIARAADIFRCPIILTTNTYRVLVLEDYGYTVNDPIWKMAEETGYCSADSVALFESEGITRQVLSNEAAFILNQGLADKIPRILNKVDIFGRAGAYIGIFQMDRSFTRLDLAACELLCDALAVSFERDPSVLRLEMNIKDSVLRDLVSGDIHSATLLNDRLRAARWKTADHFRCVLITPEQESLGISNADYLIDRIRHRSFGAQIIRVEEGLLMLLDSDGDPDGKLFDWLRATASDYGLRMYSSGIFDDLIRLREYYDLCRKMQKTAKRLMLEDRLVFFETIAVDMITEKLDGAEQSTFRQSEYGKLAAYDREHDTDYVRTVIAYIEQGCNITKAAEALFVHRNTLARRLERISEICGLSTSDGRQLMHFYLSDKMGSSPQ